MDVEVQISSLLMVSSYLSAIMNAYHICIVSNSCGCEETFCNLLVLILFFPEPLGFQGKPAFKKENGTYAYGGSSSTSAVAANNTSRRTASYRF